MALFEDDPISQPLTYPGRVPETSGVLADAAYVPLRAAPGSPVDEWRAGPETVAELLARHGGAPLEGRRLVVAVGSNAAPSQLLRKFTDHGVRPLVPMTLARVRDVAPGVSAHVSKWGYVPAAPIDTPGETSRLFALWLDERQLAALDLTEPNYRREPLAHPIALEPGVRRDAAVYRGRHGCLADGGGRPRRLTPQRALIGSLLDESSQLRLLCGDTPDEFVVNVRDDTVREAVYRLLQDKHRIDHGKVGPRDR
ncbi:hypothetical protein ABZ897_22795 [Nonomuraea sp. NPDC046802]|uniref:hypothetical protein n=1 Tax=Nonomuraea sp. NPDC046802 TaxID=3154919 RepID=UPI0033DB64CA